MAETNKVKSKKAFPSLFIGVGLALAGLAILFYNRYHSANTPCVPPNCENVHDLYSILIPVGVLLILSGAVVAIVQLTSLAFKHLKSAKK